MATVFKLDYSQIEKLEKALKEYQGNAEDAINEVLHGQGGQLIADTIRELIPESGAKWKGKRAPAKTAKSLRAANSNLAVTIRTTKNYGYLYFPDDGTNTSRHVGKKGVPQEFFRRGGESAADEIIDMCISKLINQIEKE